MSNLLEENYFLLNDLPEHAPQRRGKKIAISTIYRWVTHGLRGVKLETAYVGGIRYTSKQAFDRFVQAITNARASDPSTWMPNPAKNKLDPKFPRTPAQVRRDSEKAAKQLAAMGV